MAVHLRVDSCNQLWRRLHGGLHCSIKSLSGSVWWIMNRVRGLMMHLYTGHMTWGVLLLVVGVGGMSNGLHDWIGGGEDHPTTGILDRRGSSCTVQKLRQAVLHRVLLRDKASGTSLWLHPSPSKDLDLGAVETFLCTEVEYSFEEDTAICMVVKIGSIKWTVYHIRIIVGYHTGVTHCTN